MKIDMQALAELQDEISTLKYEALELEPGDVQASSLVEAQANDLMKAVLNLEIYSDSKTDKILQEMEEDLDFCIAKSVEASLPELDALLEAAEEEML